MIQSTFRAAKVLFSLSFSKHPCDALHWLSSLRNRSAPLRCILPWITFDATRAIESHLKNRVDAKLFEYGSGSSSVYWSRQGARVFSVEDDAEWYDLVSSHIEKAAADSIQVCFEADEDSYVQKIHHCGEKDFDVVVVDGAHRRKCVVEGVKRVKPGGLFIVDNTDWAEIQRNPIQGVPDEWHKTIYRGYTPGLGQKTETSIWKRPL